MIWYGGQLFIIAVRFLYTFTIEGLTKVKNTGIFLYKMKCSEQDKYIKPYFTESSWGGCNMIDALMEIHLQAAG